jgi:hypothetical protein
LALTPPGDWWRKARIVGMDSYLAAAPDSACLPPCAAKFTGAAHRTQAGFGSTVHLGSKFENQRPLCEHVDWSMSEWIQGWDGRFELHDHGHPHAYCEQAT